MAAKQQVSKRVKPPAALRASVSFHPALYHTLEEIAKEKRVSLAWVIREAAQRYVADQWPLFGRELADFKRRQRGR